MTTGRRNALVAVAVLCALALVITVIVRSHSPAHRADAALDDIRSMPGVAEATAQNYPESADDDRDGVVVMAESATADKVLDVLERARAVAGKDVIGDVSVRVGVARLTVTDKTEHLDEAAPVLAALARLPHGSAELTSTSYLAGGPEVRIDPDGRPPIHVARTAITLLAKHEAAYGDLSVGTQQRSSSVVIERPATASGRVLAALEPYKKQLSSVRVLRTEVTVNAGPGISTVTLHRALVPVVRKSLPGTQLTVTAGTDQPSITGVGPTSVVTRVAQQLRSDGLRLTAFNTDRRRIDVAGASGELTAKDVPRVQKSLAALDPALPGTCDITIDRSPRGYDDIFNGSPAELTRMAPRLAAAAAKGYEASWDGDHQVEVLLPPGVDLTTKSAEPAMRLARSLGWQGTLWVQIGDRADGGHGVDSAVRFRSTATGTTQSVNGNAADRQSYAVVWTRTAASVNGAAS